MTEDKTAINARVQDRYDALRAEGKHGHYETMFRIVHEERARAQDEAYAEGRKDEAEAAVSQPAAAAVPATIDVLSLLQRAHLYTNTVSVQHERAPFAVFRAELKAAIEALERQHG